MTFDQWFDTTYGDMIGESTPIVLLLSFKEVAQKAWDAALENNKIVPVPYGLRDLTK